MLHGPQAEAVKVEWRLRILFNRISEERTPVAPGYVKRAIGTWPLKPTQPEHDRSARGCLNRIAQAESLCLLQNIRWKWWWEDHDAQDQIRLCYPLVAEDLQVDLVVGHTFQEPWHGHQEFLVHGWSCPSACGELNVKIELAARRRHRTGAFAVACTPATFCRNSSVADALHAVADFRCL